MRVGAEKSSPQSPEFAITQDRVGVEAALLDTAMLDGDLSAQRSGEPKDHASVQLLFEDAGVYDLSAIDSAHDALDIWRAAQRLA
jgi:hypothetical protein